MLERVIMAGFGGQGMMFMGKLLAQVGMDEGLNVTYFPSYGAEVRGGTANCHVVLSSEEIGSPVVETADTLIMMNQPSLDKFGARLKPHGIMLANATMIEIEPNKNTVLLPVTEIASQLGDVRVANMVMLGAYHSAREVSSRERMLEGLKQSLSGKREKMFDINRAAFEEGMKACSKAADQ